MDYSGLYTYDGNPIMSYLRSQVIKSATLSSLGKETSQFQRAINLTCIKDLL